jgi:hypothetical protein
LVETEFNAATLAELNVNLGWLRAIGGTLTTLETISNTVVFSLASSGQSGDVARLNEFPVPDPGIPALGAALPRPGQAPDHLPVGAPAIMGDLHAVISLDILNKGL